MQSGALEGRADPRMLDPQTLLENRWFENTPHQTTAVARGLTEQTILHEIKLRAFNRRHEANKRTTKGNKTKKPARSIGISPFRVAALRPLPLPKGEGARCLLVKEQKTNTARPRGEKHWISREKSSSNTLTSPILANVHERQFAACKLGAADSEQLLHGVGATECHE